MASVIGNADFHLLWGSGLCALSLGLVALLSWRERAARRAQRRANLSGDVTR